jgi:Fusaric acid resistance protein-like
MGITGLGAKTGKVAGSERASAQVRTRWVDHVVSSDPGLARLRLAIQSALTIALALVAEWLFVHGTGALQIRIGAGVSAAKAAELAGANHDLLAIAMLLGAILGLISSVGVSDATSRGQLVTLLLLPVPIISSLALGIAIGGHRVIALVAIALVLAFGTYMRRFGPRGFLGGQLLFIGYFIGFSLHSAITIGDLGWLAAEVGVALVVASAVRFALFYPRPVKALQRTQRSFDAQVRHVAKLALELFDTRSISPRGVQRIHRRLLRLNEAALMIDAQLGDPDAVPDGHSGELLHQRLFDVELALTNIARFAESLASQQLPTDQRSEIRLALLDVVGGDDEGAKAHAAKLILLLRSTQRDHAVHEHTTNVVAHRFAMSVVALAEAMTEWMAVGTTENDRAAFSSSVALIGGWLPGSAQVSNAASLESGSHWGKRFAMQRHIRNAIQLGIAAGLAIALGVLISPQRFYWAVIATFIIFMGAHNAGEQIRKAFFRVGGTVIGIGVGSLLVSAVGHHTDWSITIILVTLFLGLYLVRISYTFMAIAITITVSQLYQQLGEFTNALLLVRLEETALGAAIAIVVVMVVLPLHTRQVLRVAMSAHTEAIGRLVHHAGERLLGRDDQYGTTLRSDARAVDAAYQAVVATAQPIRRTLSGGTNESIARALRLTSASRTYSRNLVVDVENSKSTDVNALLGVDQASATLDASIEVVARALTGRRDGIYARSSALFDEAEQKLECLPLHVDSTELVLRDFRLIDGTMAQLAEFMGLTITDFDTVGMRS